MRHLLACLLVLAGCSSRGAPVATGSAVASSAASTGAGGAGGASPGSGGAGGVGPWRSALYPVGWTPSFTDGAGRFLHDFSYAGYHNGEAEPGAPASAPVLDAVATYGADPTGMTDATPAVQQALDAAGAMGGGVVLLGAGLYRFDGTLTVKASSVVLRGAGAAATRLFFSQAQGLTDSANLLFTGDGSVDLEVPLVDDGVPRQDFVDVADPGDLAPGDDVSVGWVITPDFVAEHGMTGVWTAFNGTWQSFFRRTVVSVDATSSPPRVVLDVPLRYPAKMRDQASVRRQKGLLRECGVESLGISNAVDWDDAWTSNGAHVIQMFAVEDAWVRDVASFPSPLAPTSGPGAGAHFQSGGLLVAESKRVTVSGSTFGLAENRGNNGNGYLFEVQRSSEVLFRDCVGDGGRHAFIQNWGFGTTGCVWLRVHSLNGISVNTKDDTLELTGDSNFHHSLATANLIDSSTFDDGFSVVNRGTESTGAGHTGTEDVLWNLDGTGTLQSLQFGWGYVIGTRQLYPVVTDPSLPTGQGTAPVDWVEGLDRGGSLSPSSLYEDQLAGRTMGK